MSCCSEMRETQSGVTENRIDAMIHCIAASEWTNYIVFYFFIDRDLFLNLLSTNLFLNYSVINKKETRKYIAYEIRNFS
jgi:hypothetical protein